MRGVSIGDWGLGIGNNAKNNIDGDCCFNCDFLGTLLAVYGSCGVDEEGRRLE